MKKLKEITLVTKAFVEKTKGNHDLDWGFVNKNKGNHDFDRGFPEKTKGNHDFDRGFSEQTKRKYVFDRGFEYVLFSLFSAGAAPKSFSFLYFRDQQPLNTFVFLHFRHHGGPKTSNYVFISIFYEVTVRESIAN